MKPTDADLWGSSISYYSDNELFYAATVENPTELNPFLHISPSLIKVELFELDIEEEPIELED